MHDPYFDNRLDPRPLPLLNSTFARLVGAAVLTVAAVAPIAFVAGLIGAIGASNL